MKKICDDLEFILKNELQNGNCIKKIYKNTFENCDLLVVLEKKFTKNYEIEKIPNHVKVHTDKDPHYLIGKGYFCNKHKHDLFSED